MLSNGKRCPNAALPGSRYCGLEAHQALAAIAGDNVADLSADGGGTVATADAARRARLPRGRASRGWAAVRGRAERPR